MSSLTDVCSMCGLFQTFGGVEFGCPVLSVIVDDVEGVWGVGVFAVLIVFPIVSIACWIESQFFWLLWFCPWLCLWLVPGCQLCFQFFPGDLVCAPFQFGFGACNLVMLCWLRG